MEFQDVPSIIDHIDGDGENNAPSNLREATHQQNLWNTTARSVSGLKGVKKTRSGKWEAGITINGKYAHLGTFNREEEAAVVYRQKAIETRGEFARF